MASYVLVVLLSIDANCEGVCETMITGELLLLLLGIGIGLAILGVVMLFLSWVPGQYRLWAALLVIAVLFVFVYADWPKNQEKVKKS